MSFLQDIIQVIYAPKRAFNKIVSNPKYLGALIILLLFIGVQIGYEYIQFSKTHTEGIYPIIYFDPTTGALVDELPNYTNATNWTTASNINLTNNADFYNYSVYLAGFNRSPLDSAAYYPIFGNTSLQIQAANTNNVIAALGNTSNVDCSATGFQNLSMAIKLVSPQAPPTKASITLYSLSDANSYTYDFTPMLTNTSTAGQWENLTIPVGPNTHDWTEKGSPTWSNITSLVLNFNYPAGSDVNIRVGALYFRGLYISPVQYGVLGIVLQFIQIYPLQFVELWLLFSAIAYLFLRVLKTPVTWKPIFVAFGFAMVVMVLRGVINIVAALTIQTSYYPFDVLQGTRFDSFGALYFPSEAVAPLSIASQNAASAIDSATAAFHTIITTAFIVFYAWLGVLGFYALGALKPELTTPKKIAIVAASLTIAVFVLFIFPGLV